LLVQADAGRFAFTCQFRFVYISANSLTYLGDRTREDHLDCVANHPAPGGAFAFGCYGTPGWLDNLGRQIRPDYRRLPTIATSL
jgi:hypothetical protein